MKRVLSLLVDDNPGVLSRISGLFSRRCYNVDSITAGVTADPRFTRITIVTSGDELILSQIDVYKRQDCRMDSGRCGTKGTDFLDTLVSVCDCNAYAWDDQRCPSAETEKSKEV